ncbi:iron ABC transporter permease [Glycomyces sp. L485]|uniref:FecCD family ABC transporter permease n=1 Tax=Glycomyces sp. L485 TaxID=2909235 RepID=UPI001F4A9DD3|nr:iron ABC transporter permease [Glycomyces sp. L485]MCH7232011.1 iron ABC transporter permease [Glycomyces sp. L485]
MSRPRQLAVIATSALALAAALAASVAIGSVTLPLGDVLDALKGANDAESHLIVRELRVPRTVAGLVAGACLGVSGVLLQGATRNPLASPAMLGITAGAGFAVVVTVALLGLPSGHAVWAAFGGGAAGFGIALLLAGSGRDGLSPVRLALSGAIVSTMLAAWTTAILTLNEYAAEEVRDWLAGSLAGRDITAVAPLLPLVAAALILAWALARPLDALALGDEAAVGLGQRPGRVRLAAAVAALALAAVAVAMAGPIAFVGLAVPHIARFLVGGGHRALLVASVLLGPALLLVADVIGRIVARPSEVQAGVITALIGAPVLVRIVMNRKVAL